MINRLLKAFAVAIALAGSYGSCHSAVLSAATVLPASIRVLVVTSRAKDHSRMIAAATPMLTRMAADNHFHVDITNDDTVINDANLARYRVFVQLQEAPFEMSLPEQAALQRFIKEGHGWVGIHAAGLTGKQFLAGHEVLGLVRDLSGWRHLFATPALSASDLVIEDHRHPITRNLPDKMVISDEWYEFNESPRSRVHVLRMRMNRPTSPTNRWAITP